MYLQNNFEIKFRCFFVLTALIFNAVFPSFYNFNNSLDKTPICTAYGIKYISDDTGDDKTPIKNKHCSLCLAGKSLSDGLLFKDSFDVVDLYLLSSEVIYFYEKHGLLSFSFLKSYSRGPPIFA